MDKVYILFTGTYHEGGRNISTHRTPQGAEQAAEKYALFFDYNRDSSNTWRWEKGCDYLKIIETNVKD